MSLYSGPTYLVAGCSSGQRDRTRELLEFDKGIVLAVGSYADKIGLSNQKYYRSCYKVEEMESLQYFLCECFILYNRRHRSLW